jgi:hypothetical protein
MAYSTQGRVTSCFYLNLKILPPGGRLNVLYFQDRTGTLLNRFKEARTWVLANETTPIVIPLKNYCSHNFFGLLTDIFDHSWIQVAVSLPKPAVSLPKRPYHSRFGSETVIHL